MDMSGREKEFLNAIRPNAKIIVAVIGSQFPSFAAARRMVANGAVFVNGTQCKDIDRQLLDGDVVTLWGHDKDIVVGS